MEERSYLSVVPRDILYLMLIREAPAELEKLLVGCSELIKIVYDLRFDREYWASAKCRRNEAPLALFLSGTLRRNKNRVTDTLLELEHLVKYQTIQRVFDYLWTKDLAAIDWWIDWSHLNVMYTMLGNGFLMEYADYILERRIQVNQEKPGDVAYMLQNQSVICIRMAQKYPDEDYTRIMLRWLETDLAAFEAARLQGMKYNKETLLFCMTQQGRIKEIQHLHSVHPYSLAQLTKEFDRTGTYHNVKYYLTQLGVPCTQTQSYAVLLGCSHGDQPQDLQYLRYLLATYKYSPEDLMFVRKYGHPQHHAFL